MRPSSPLASSPRSPSPLSHSPRTLARSPDTSKVIVAAGLDDLFLDLDLEDALTFVDKRTDILDSASSSLALPPCAPLTLLVASQRSSRRLPSASHASRKSTRWCVGPNSSLSRECAL